jgi:hypothetical protein
MTAASAALVRERVSRAHGGANLRHEEAALPIKLQDFTQRNFQVFLNVVAQRLVGSFRKRELGAQSDQPSDSRSSSSFALRCPCKRSNSLIASNS